MLLLIQLQVLLQVQSVGQGGPLRELGVDLGDVRKSKWKSEITIPGWIFIPTKTQIHFGKLLLSSDELFVSDSHRWNNLGLGAYRLKSVFLEDCIISAEIRSFLAGNTFEKNQNIFKK